MGTGVALRPLAFVVDGKPLPVLARADARGRVFAEKRTLYVRRPVLNAAVITEWAKAQGFKTTLPPEDMHVTVCFSKRRVDWSKFAQQAFTLLIAGDERTVSPLGGEGAVVLKFNSQRLQVRHQEFLRGGASWDYDSYHPHVTITYDAGDVDLSNVVPYAGLIELGGEVFDEVKEGWADDIKEHAQSVDFAQIERTLDDLESRFARELDAELREALDAVTAKVKAAGEDYADLSRTLALPNKQGIGGAFRDALRRALDAGGEAARRETTGARAFVAWDESKHPRAPKGDEKGGEFAPITERTVLHHGTAKEYLDSILKDGIVLHEANRKKIIQQGRSAWLYRGDRGQAVFLTTNAKDALAYGESTAEAAGGLYTSATWRGKWSPLRQGYLGGDLKYPLEPQRNPVAEIAIIHVKFPKGRVRRLVGDVHDNLTSPRAALQDPKATGRGWRDESGKIQPKYIVGYTIYERELGSTGGVRPRTGGVRKVKEVKFTEVDTSDLYLVVAFDGDDRKVTLFAEPSFTPRGTLRWLREKAFWVTGLMSDQLEDAIKGVIVTGLKVGTPNSVIITEIAEAFAPYLMSGEETALLPAHRLENIVRTNTTSAYNQGRLTEFTNPDLSPYMNGFEYSIILDVRTTDTCRFLGTQGGKNQTEGFVFRPDDPALAKLTPSNHWQCRAILVPRVVGDDVPPEAFITPEQVEEALRIRSEEFPTWK